MTAYDEALEQEGDIQPAECALVLSPDVYFQDAPCGCSLVYLFDSGAVGLRPCVKHLDIGKPQPKEGDERDSRIYCN